MSSLDTLMQYFKALNPEIQAYVLQTALTTSITAITQQKLSSTIGSHHTAHTRPHWVLKHHISTLQTLTTHTQSSMSVAAFT